jgi:hypothetical protein
VYEISGGTIHVTMNLKNIKSKDKLNGKLKDNKDNKDDRVLRKY